MFRASHLARAREVLIEQKPVTCHPCLSVMILWVTGDRCFGLRTMSG